MRVRRNHQRASWSIAESYSYCHLYDVTVEVVKISLVNYE